MTSTVDVLAALCAHLAVFELPAITSLYVAAGMPTPEVTVQLTCREPSAIAGGLLAWADTLTEVTAEAWRTPGGDSVHLSVIGLLPGVASVRVYRGLRITDYRPGSDLEPDDTTTVSLMTLRHLATSGQGTEGVTL